MQRKKRRGGKGGGGNSHDRAVLRAQKDGVEKPIFETAPRQEPMAKEEAKFKWQDAVGIIGAFLAVGGMTDMPLYFRLGCFLVCAVTAPLSFSSHNAWPKTFRWVASVFVILLMMAVSWFAVSHPEQRMPSATEIASDVLKGISSNQSSERQTSSGSTTASAKSPSDLPDPNYPSPKGPLVREDFQAVLPSSQMCLGLAGQERINCLCPNPLKYSLKALSAPTDNNYSTELDVRAASVPFYHIRVFGRTQLNARYGYTTEPSFKDGGFAAFLGVLSYDPDSFTFNATKPIREFKIEIHSSEGLRLYCINQDN